jgi:Toprim domain
MSLAARIAEQLAGRQVTERGGNYLVPCPAHDDSSPSLSLRDGDDGLMVHCFADCEPVAIYVAIRRKLGKDALTPGDTAPKPVKGTAEYERRQGEKAAWLWSQRRPITGSIAERYLRAARGYSGPLPPTLGFLPAYKQHPPSMIAAYAIPDEPEPGIIAPPRDVDSVHITRLLPDGSNRERGDSAKITVGSPRTRPIALAPPNDLRGLAITEGIEDALTAHVATGLGAWAAGCASFMPKLADTVPSFIEAVTIFAHPDKAGQDNARRLAAALTRRGIEVSIEGLA